MQKGGGGMDRKGIVLWIFIIYVFTPLPPPSCCLHELLSRRVLPDMLAASFAGCMQSPIPLLTMMVVSDQYTTDVIPAHLLNAS